MTLRRCISSHTRHIKLFCSFPLVSVTIIVIVKKSNRCILRNISFCIPRKKETREDFNLLCISLKKTFLLIMGGISALLLPFHWASCLGLISTENWQTTASNALMFSLAFGITDHIIIGWHNWDKAWFSKALAPLIRCASVRLITVVYQKQHAFHPLGLRGGRRWKPKRVVSLHCPSQTPEWHRGRKILTAQVCQPIMTRPWHFWLKEKHRYYQLLPQKELNNHGLTFMGSSTQLKRNFCYLSRLPANCQYFIICLCW